MTWFMATSLEAYVDTSALIAFVDRSDTYHPLFRLLFSDPPDLVTTTLVVAEGHGWFLKRYDRTRALRFISLLEVMTPLRIIPIGPDELTGGVKRLRQFSDQDLSLTDAIGLWTMDQHKLRVCWSTDHHLRLTGIPLVIDQH
jgi:predicted nucleic acid-binding protein